MLGGMSRDPSDGLSSAVLFRGGRGGTGSETEFGTQRSGEVSTTKYPLQAGHLSFAVPAGIRSGESLNRLLQ